MKLLTQKWANNNVFAKIFNLRPTLSVSLTWFLRNSWHLWHHLLGFTLMKIRHVWPNRKFFGHKKWFLTYLPYIRNLQKLSELDQVYCAWLNKGLLCLYILKKLRFGQVSPIPNTLTHSQTREYRATQLVESIKFKLSHAISQNGPKFFVHMLKSTLAQKKYTTAGCVAGTYISYVG